MFATASGTGRSAAAVLLGVALGLGALTKVFFLPISAGMVGFLMFRCVSARDDAALFSLRAQRIVLVVAVAGVCGGWWYASSLLTSGSVPEFATVSNHGGMASDLREKFGLMVFARGIAALLGSWYYAGTWSLARLPLSLYAPGLVL